MDYLTFTKVVVDGKRERGSIIKGIPKWAADKDIEKKGSQIVPKLTKLQGNREPINDERLLPNSLQLVSAYIKYQPTCMYIFLMTALRENILQEVRPDLQ